MQNKQLGLIKLINGEDPQDIANDLDVTLTTVTRWNAELEKAKSQDKVNQLVQLSEVAVDQLVDLAQDKSLNGELLEAIDETAESIKGLQRLEKHLQGTATKMLDKIRIMAATAENVSEITELTTALCSIQTAFFGKGTQVNVQNNYGDSGYAEFLSDSPGS